MGGGIALLDYDNDDRLDIFMVNGSRVSGFLAAPEPTNHLYHNNRDGTFTDVTISSGLVCSGGDQGVCAGDFANEGWLDLV
jgi:hypothetical protein